MGAAGTSGSADGFTSAARFNYPWGIGGFGERIYVGDSSNRTVRQLFTKVSLLSVPSTVATYTSGTQSTIYPVLMADKGDDSLDIGSAVMEYRWNNSGTWSTLAYQPS